MTAPRQLLPVCALLASALGLAAPAPAGPRVDNFVLLDHTGKAHELYYLSDMRAVVLMVQGNGCPIVRNALPALEQVRDRYRDRGVAFLLLNSNLQDDRESIQKEVSEFTIDFPVLLDETQLIGEALELDRTAEVLLIDPRGWNLVYRGPVDDRLSYERQKPRASHHYLVDALDAFLAGRPVEEESRGAPGCLINFPGRDGAGPRSSISYPEAIAPLLRENCVSCHRPGGVGSWAMSSYRMILGFAPMIREVLRTRRMPPWHADPHINTFENAQDLSVEEVRTLVHWIEAGAPRGEGPDPLVEELPEPTEWTLGEPDRIVVLPPFKVPATGVVELHRPVVRNTLDHGVWLRAAELIPLDHSVAHHMVAGHVTRRDRGGDWARDIYGHLLGGYVPGVDALPYPEDTGVYLPAGGAFTFELHYTTTGRATTDVPRLGLYFAEAPPKHRLHYGYAYDPTIRIPAGEKEHLDSSYWQFDRDVLLYGLHPHAHFRGRWARADAEYPDGSRETLLSVPRYDFNWQRYYTLREPKRLPAGTRLVFSFAWDNSAQNAGNPDPSQTVLWGGQSWDEMLFGSFYYRVLEGDSVEQLAEPVPLVAETQLLGYMDTDRDGRLSPEELHPVLRQKLGFGFSAADRDGDGGLDRDEIAAAGLASGLD